MRAAAYVLDIETIPEGLAFGETNKIHEPYTSHKHPGKQDQQQPRHAPATKQYQHTDNP